jgi:hypothetical protein
MAWIKRNLFFAIGGAVALVLMGLAGYYAYSKWALNNQINDSLNADYEELHRLNTAPIHPGNEQINNIQIAQDQQKQLKEFIKKTRAYCQNIAPIPDLPKISDPDFSTALTRTIDRMQKDATNNSVTLPPDYAFSFQAEKNKVGFNAAGLAPLSVQLGEVKTICNVLFQAKVNSLDNLRRERVSVDDNSGPQTDYVTEKSVTNELAVMTPYELTFKCFSSELAAVLSGFASSPNGLIVKTINVKSAPSSTTETPGGIVGGTPNAAAELQMQAARAQAEQAAAQRAMASRYGLAPGGADRYGGAGRYGPGGGNNLGGIQYRPLTPGGPAGYAPQPPPTGYAPPPIPTGAKGGALPIVLDEKQLEVTINLVLVKMLPAK